MIRRRRKNNSFIEWFLQPFTSRRIDGHQPDFVLLATIGLLLFFGLVFLSSASSTLGFYKYQDTYRFLKQQITHGLLPGLLLFYLAIRINYQYYRKLAWIGLLGSFVLLILVFLTGLGGDYSAQSWITFGNFSFQPDLTGGLISSNSGCSRSLRLVTDTQIGSISRFSDFNSILIKILSETILNES